jgi:hypothetical protein
LQRTEYSRVLLLTADLIFLSLGPGGNKHVIERNSVLGTYRQSSMIIHTLGPKYVKIEWEGYGIYAPGPPITSERTAGVLDVLA